ncbi:MAG: TolC family protein [Planctomycetota bacterium]
MRRFPDFQVMPICILLAGSVCVGLASAQTTSSPTKTSSDNPFAQQFSRAYQSINEPKRITPAVAQLPSSSVQKTTPRLVQKTASKPVPNDNRFNAKPQPVLTKTIPPSVRQSSEPPLEFNYFGTPKRALQQQSAIVPKLAQAHQPAVSRLADRSMNQTVVPMSRERTQEQGLFTSEQSNEIAWWKTVMQTQLRENSTPQMIETNALVFHTLQQSPRIKALSQNPLIRELQVDEAEAEFDPTSFLRTQFQDRVDPVGDNLSTTNDGTNFLDDHIWTGDLGVRRKLETGASYELSQRLGFRNSNSAFFNPQDQGTATLALNVTQPLLRGRGRYYNRSQILIAQKTTGVAWNTFQTELQDEIQKTVEAYWRLYYDRSVYLQKQRNVERAQKILATLQGRASLDSLPSQIARARSAVLSRKTDLANARRDIRNSETEIRRLIADQDWQASQLVEMLPAELPVIDGPKFEIAQVITTALENRTEIKETLQRVRIAAVQRDISSNELLPELSLLMGTYVSTLQGDSQIGDAFVDQFAGGGVKPGYSVGLEFEVPIGNRSARSRLTQRKLQLTKLKSEVDETMQNVVAESQIALRRVHSARETIVAATEAIVAAKMDLDQNSGRWESFALVEGDIAEGQTPTTILDQLLDSQERLTAAELVYAQAEMELKTAETALQRTMGTLLIQRNVNFGTAEIDGQPVVGF